MLWLSPRWLKVLRDLWDEQDAAPILVLLSIAIGVAAIGIGDGRADQLLTGSLPEAYAAINPARAPLYTFNTFDDKMVESVEALPEVAEAEARRSVSVRFRTAGSDEWRNMSLIAIPDYENITINKIKPVSGEYPPPLREVLIERASFSDSVGLGDAAIGDELVVESPSGRLRTMRIAGSVHDMSQLPAFMSGGGYGYVDFETLAWLNEPRDFNELVFVVADNPMDEAHVTEVAKLIEKRMESSGVNVVFTLVFSPGEHPAQSFLDAFSLILGAIGVLALGLSSF